MPWISGGGSSGGGSGTVTSVTSANNSVTVTNTTTTPVLTVGTVDKLFTNNAPTAAMAANAQKITGLANGSAAQDAAAFGQTPVGGTKVTSAQMIAPTGGIGSGSAVDSYVRDVARMNAAGIAGWNWPPDNQSGNTNPGSGEVEAQLVGLVAGDVVTNIIFGLNTAASGTNPTGVFAGLYAGSKTGARLALSANLNASAIWTSTGFAVAPLTAPFTVLTTGGYYLVVLINGSWSVTQPQFINGGAFVATNSFVVGSGVPFSPNQTGQTTLPATANFAGSGQHLWVGWN
jgi:hypothetical protein